MPKYQKYLSASALYLYLVSVSVSVFVSCIFCLFDMLWLYLFLCTISGFPFTTCQLTFQATNTYTHSRTYTERGWHNKNYCIFILLLSNLFVVVEAHAFKLSFLLSYAKNRFLVFFSISRLFCHFLASLERRRATTTSKLISTRSVL